LHFTAHRLLQTAELITDHYTIHQQDFQEYANVISKQTITQVNENN